MYDFDHLFFFFNRMENALKHLKCFLGVLAHLGFLDVGATAFQV